LAEIVILYVGFCIHLISKCVKKQAIFIKVEDHLLT